jgi:predicted CopG family antitoxin
MPTRANQCTITVSNEIREGLRKYKEPNDTWDDIIGEVLEEVENVRGTN